MRDINVKQIAEEIQKGDQDAFKRLYDAYFEKIYGFLLTILRNSADAEDVTSVAFTYVWNNRGKLQKPEQMVSWLYQIAKHRAFDLIRREKTRGTADLAVYEEVIEDEIVVSPEESAQRYFSSQLAHQLLDRLSEQERSIVHLRFAEDLSFQEMAERLHMTSVALRVRLHRIIKKLQKEINKESGEQETSFWRETIL